MDITNKHENWTQKLHKIIIQECYSTFSFMQHNLTPFFNFINLMDEIHTMPNSNNTIYPSFPPLKLDEQISTRYLEDLMVSIDSSKWATTPTLTPHNHNTPSWVTTTTPNTTWANTISNPQSTWANIFKPNEDIYHNKTGPAVITQTAVKWYIEGKQIYSTKLFCHEANHTDESTMFWLLTYGEKLPATPDEFKYLVASFNDWLTPTLIVY